MDALIVNFTSFSGNKIGQVYTNGKSIVYVDPRSTKYDCGMTLGLFCEIFGIPVKLIYDRDPEQVSNC